MKVQHGKDVASHSGPESCGDAREGVIEALTGETGGSAIEPRNQDFGTPTQLSDAEGKTNQDASGESWDGPARSETLHTPGSSGKAKCHTTEPSAAEKSDAFILPGKPSNKGVDPTEMVEGRNAAKGNAEQAPAPRT